jgi:hypothetical protein
MTPYRRFFCLMTAALGVAIAPCGAQEPPAMALQFMTFPMTMEPLKVELLVGEGKTVPLEVPSNELGPVVRVPRMPSLVFGETVLNAEQKPEFKVYGKGKPAAEPKQLVLLLRKGPDMAGGFEVRAIPSDIKNFDGGKILFVNAARVDIGGKTGKVPFALKPGAHAIVKPGLEANGRLSHVEFFYSLDGKAVPFFSSMWPVAKEFRGLVFFYNDPNNANQIQLHSFRHFLEADG